MSDYPGALDPKVRDLIWITVPWNVRAALADLLPLYGVHSPEHWPAHPEIRAFLEYTAVRVLQARARRAGYSPTAALAKACERLKLHPGNVRKHFYRSQKRFMQALTDSWDKKSRDHEKQALG